MGNCCSAKKRCKVCATKNKSKNTYICEECQFIPTYIIKYGRENLKRIIHNSYQDYERPFDNSTELSYFDKANNEPIRKPSITAMLTIQPKNPSPPASAPIMDMNESSTDNLQFKPLERCKSMDCNCHNRHLNMKRNSVYPPSY